MIKRTVVRCFVAVLMLFMGSVFLRFFTLQILIQELRMDSAFTKTVFFDELLDELLETDIDTVNLSELYPFQENTPDNKSKLGALKNRIINGEERIEKYTKKLLINHIQFIELAVKYEKAAGWNILNADIFDLGDGYLTEVIKEKLIHPPSPRHSSGINTPAGALYEFNDFLQESGVEFLYIQSPHKINGDDSIAGTLDFSGKNADELLYALSLRQIPYVDLRENIRKDNIDHRSLFYRTDHHWKTETGLWAAKTIAGYLNENNGFTIDLTRFDPEQYQYDLFENWHFGILGKKVTLVQAAADDFAFIYPKFATDFSLKIPDKNVDVRGDFDAFIEHAMLDRKNYYLLDAYGAYLYGNRPVINIRNNMLRDGKKVLLIKDSFANVVAPFLSMGIENLDMLDVRLFDGSVKTYIEKNKPDMVIMLYNQAAIASEELFDFR